MNHMANISKDRMQLFKNTPEIRLGTETGKMLYDWCVQGTEVSDIKEAEQRIAESRSLKELTHVYNLYPELRKDLLNQFKQRKAELQQKNQFTTSKLSDNGTDDN
jgi:hypothetical protein